MPSSTAMKPPQAPSAVHRVDPEDPGASLTANRADPEDAFGAEPGGGDHVADGQQQSVEEYPNKNMVMASRIGLLVTYICVIYAGGTVVRQLIQEESERHVFAWAVAGLFVCLAVPLSLHDIHMHIMHYVSPLQKYYIRIIWMVPIYAIESWLALRFKEQKYILETAREAYEAWVIYSFYRLMLTFIGRTDEEAQQTINDMGREHAHMMFPLCKLPPWRLRDGQFLRITGFGVFQYVWIRVFFAVIGVFADLTGNMEEGEFEVNKLYMYEVIIVNISQSWALYCLVMFYHELIVPLANIKPFVKFVAIKCIIFLSFWQSVLISVLSELGAIEATMDYTEEEISKGLQDFLICIEMAMAATIHRQCFSYRDFRKGGPLLRHLERCGETRKSTRDAVMEMLPIEVVRDIDGAITRRISMFREVYEKQVHAAEQQWAGAGAAAAGGGDRCEKDLKVEEPPKVEPAPGETGTVVSKSGAASAACQAQETEEAEHSGGGGLGDDQAAEVEKGDVRAGGGDSAGRGSGGA